MTTERMVCKVTSEAPAFLRATDLWPGDVIEGRTVDVVGQVSLGTRVLFEGRTEFSSPTIYPPGTAVFIDSPEVES